MKVSGYQIVEHTADVGIRAWAGSLEDLFTEVTYGLLDIAGTRGETAEQDVAVDLEAPDLGALLVDWLSEVLYLQDGRDAVIQKVAIDEVRDGRVRGRVSIGPRGDAVLQGTAVKAITYHQLRVEKTDSGWEATVYVDV